MSAAALLEDTHLDALREMANIGCGHAANALSKLMGGRRIDIDVPRVAQCDFAQVPGLFGGPEIEVVVVSLDVQGRVQGRLLLLMERSQARALAGLLLGTPPGKGDISEDERSAISEVANILASACLTAIGKALSMTLLPTIPLFAEDMAGAVLDEAVAGMARTSDRALVIETRFSASGEKRFEGHILVLPDLPTLPHMLKAMGL